MRDEGIEEGDILVIDKSLELMDDDLAVCFIDGDFTVKRVRLESDTAWLVPSNVKYPPIKVTKDNEFMEHHPDKQSRHIPNQYSDVHG